METRQHPSSVERKNQPTQRGSRIHSEQEVLEKNEAKELGDRRGMKSCAKPQGEPKSERPQGSHHGEKRLSWPRGAEHCRGAGRSHGMAVSTSPGAADPRRGGW